MFEHSRDTFYVSDGISFSNLRFENDVEMYGVQTFRMIRKCTVMLENALEKGRERMCGIIVFMFFMFMLGWALLPYNILLGVICLMIPLGMSCLFARWTFQDEKKYRQQRKNRRELIDLLVNYIKSNGIIYATARDKNTTQDGIDFKSKNQEMYFRFYDYGYANISWQEMVELFKTMEKKLNGYLKIYYRDVGGYDDTITSVSTGFTPGGGTGYYANRAGGGSSRVEDRVELYFGQAAIYRQNADIEYERKRKSLKRI